jgi:antitoxin component YwqK of YwqJK toxin-antitoxin module
MFKITVNQLEIPYTDYTFTGEVVKRDDSLIDIPKYHAFVEELEVSVVPKKGRLYKNGAHVYTGKFTKDGLYTGQAVLYYSNGNIRYEGEFRHHNYSGFGKEYDKKGNLLYEGEWVNGLQYGKGKQYENDMMIYDGYWFEGAKTGNGIDYSSSLCIYEGLWKDNMWHGRGTHYCEDGSIIHTTWSCGKKQGFGNIELPDGTFHVNCEWHNDQLIQEGEHMFPSRRLKQTRNGYRVVK